jgi:fructose-1-phosphate kinase PfkB-like protein
VRLIEETHLAGPGVWVDASGEALEAALTIPGIGIKVNGTEAASLLGHAISDMETAWQVAAELRNQGPAIVALTLGAIGALMVSDEGGWWAQPPALRVVSAVGSGDAFLAGLVTALTAGKPQPDALRWAVAAGAANALVVGGGRFRLGDFHSALAATSAHRVPDAGPSSVFWTKP